MQFSLLIIFYCQCHGTCVLGLGLVSILLSIIFSDVTERKREFMLHKTWLSEEMTARRGGKANDEEQARQGQERGRVRTREEVRVETLVKGDSAGQDRKTLCYDFFI